MTLVQIVATTLGIGRVEEGGVALLDSPFPQVRDVLEQAGSLASLGTCPVRARRALEECTLLAPLGRPHAIWGVGLNYRSKAALSGRALPSDPILYLAAPSAVLAPGAPVFLPADASTEPDYEAEIAVVIGSRLYRAPEQDVWAAVAGITAANDMTARDVMRATDTPTLAKSFPGFTPMGASVATLDELPDRDRIRVRSWVNGSLRQDDTSDGMVFTITELISRLSWFSALEPGDVVLTGTPAGTGQDIDCFLGDGDEVRVEIDGVLELVTPVARAAPVAASGPQLAEPVG